uniref:Uncharacterized protein n=1 Tax=Cacopsylla melanoneura TaxID=428564 RepID=A0A8D9A2Q3_9HEMI
MVLQASSAGPAAAQQLTAFVAHTAPFSLSPRTSFTLAPVVMGGSCPAGGATPGAGEGAPEGGGELSSQLTKTVTLKRQATTRQFLVDTMVDSVFCDEQTSATIALSSTVITFYTQPLFAVDCRF